MRAIKVKDLWTKARCIRLMGFNPFYSPSLDFLQSLNVDKGNEYTKPQNKVIKTKTGVKV